MGVLQLCLIKTVDGQIFGCEQSWPHPLVMHLLKKPNTAHDFDLGHMLINNKTQGCCPMPLRELNFQLVSF